jgi:ketosteroid isomerase-like protein
MRVTTPRTIRRDRSAVESDPSRPSVPAALLGSLFVDASEVMSGYAAAWEAGDVERAWTFYAEDVVMHLPGRSSLAGDHRGRSAVIAAIRALLDRTDDSTAAVEVVDRLVSGDRVAMVLREVVARGDARLELRRVNIYRIEAGKIVDIDIYEANQYELDEFFA